MAKKNKNTAPVKEGDKVTVDFAAEGTKEAVVQQSETSDNLEVKFDTPTESGIGSVQLLPTTEDAAADYNITPIDHPALASIDDEPVTVPAGTLDGAEGEIEEDTEFVGEDGGEGVVKAGTRVQEEPADPEGFDHPAVLARIAELNSSEIHAQGEEVKITLGSQTLTGTVAGHDVNKGQVSYHVSIQVAPGNFITGQAPRTLELPIPAEFVSK